MLQQIIAQNDVDDDGRPAGGFVRGVGLSIDWQDGPLGQRIAHYNAVGSGCDENDQALEHLDAALAALQSRTARRELAGVEGTHEGT